MYAQVSLVPFYLRAHLLARTLHSIRYLLEVPALCQPGLKVLYKHGENIDVADTSGIQLQPKERGLIVSKHLVDSVVIHEIAGIVQDGLPFVDLDSLKDVGAVPVENVGAGIHQFVGEGFEGCRWPLPHIRSPVCRGYYQIGSILSRSPDGVF